MKQNQVHKFSKDIRGVIKKIANDMKRKDAWSRGYQSGLYRAMDEIENMEAKNG